MSREWLKKFRDDQATPRPAEGRKRARDSGWLDEFHDDEIDPDWLERFRDDEPEKGLRPRPAPDAQRPAGASRNIRLFEWLMYISLAVEVTTTASDFAKLAELAGGWPVVVLTDVFTLAFFGAFIFAAVYLRQKWALYVIAAFYGFRLLRYIPSFAYIALPLVQFLSAIEFVLQGLALYYAFSGEARAHFAKRNR